MLWPTLCIDNFFRNVDAVIEFANKVKYTKTKGQYPGERSAYLHKIAPDFFHTTTQKIVASLYPDVAFSPALSWNAEQYFQKINTQEHKLPGFIHQDVPKEFTCIVYLTDEEKAGTSLYTKIKEPTEDDKDSHHKIKGYTDLKYRDDSYFKKALKKNRNSFKKVLQYTACKNRLVLFDSSQYHGVDHFGSKDPERLTLITFFNSLYRTNGQPLKFHVNECTRL